MRIHGLLLVGVALAVGADAPTDAAKKELAKLQGRWVMVSCERDGAAVPADDVKTFSRTVKGNKYTIVVKGEEFGGTIALDPTKKPKTIDAMRTAGADKGKAMLGIYEIAGNTQKVCFAPVGKDRPTEFSSKAGTGHVLTVWKRVGK